MSEPAGRAGKLFSRDEVLGGLPARRARSLLFLIEARTAKAVLGERQALDPLLSPAAAQEHELAILDAFRLGRTPPVPVRVQDLERHAASWSALVPPNPQLRAATAHALAEKYPLARGHVSGIARALGLDDPAVAEAYQRLYRQPVDGIYLTRLPWRERRRWAWAALGRRLEAMPPAWTVFALVFTETVGAGVLALPIAMARLGAAAGLVLLVGVGLVSMVTIGYLSEAVVRNGPVRYGSGFLGRVMEDYLGRAGSLLLTAGLAAICVLALVAYYVGLATLLQDATGIRPELWVVLFFLVGLYFASRRSLRQTMTAALVVGAVNLALILLLSALALTHARPEQWAYIDPALLTPGRFDPAVLELVFGVALCAYFGHLTISNCARVVLQRDPGGRSLILGSMSAQAVVIGVYCLWVFAVVGAVPRQELAATHGTALSPLEAQLGPVVFLLGGAFAVLAMGMASIHYSLGLTNLVRERLPRAAPPAATALPGTLEAAEAALRQAPAESLAADGAGRRAAWRGRSWGWRGLLPFVPLVLVFLATEWQFATGNDSFTEPLNIIGVIVVSLLGVLFPALLLLASRRKGDRTPALVLGLLSRRPIIGAVIALSIASLVLHGTVIWTDPLRRAFALVTSAAVLLVTGNMVRHGAFRPRVVLEARLEPGGARLAFDAHADGQPYSAPLTLETADGTARALAAPGEAPPPGTLVGLGLDIPADLAHSVKVWSHTLAADGDSRPFPAQVRLDGADGTIRRSLPAPADALELRLDGGAQRVELRWPAAGDRASDSPQEAS
jgi:amino acid permease